MAKTKSPQKKPSKTAKTIKKAPAAKAVAKKAKSATPAKPKKTSAPAPATAKKPVQPVAKAPEGAETNWSDAIKAALERRHQQPDYPGAGSNSWKNRSKH